MRFNLLGPLEAFSNDTPVGLGGFNQRATAGFLLLHANEVVPTSKLMHALWGYDSPVTSRKMVQNSISGLRRILDRHAGPEGPVALTTCAPGYRLTVAPDGTDLGRFHRLVDRGRAELAAGHRQSGLSRLREALTLWRGPALVDLTESGISWPELTAIAGTRRAVFEDCAKESLDQGKHYEILGELEEMAAAEPTGERICGLLMLALYRCGRQRDALSAYQRTRTVLRDEFGLDPGRELRELELAVLNQDPSLNLTHSPNRLHTIPTPTVVRRCSRLSAARGARPTGRRLHG
ncbi:AfsR/SARP family transcriptional regulator [Streptomyces cavernicola]|uniref:AfsR/SARP family transcriptional regulator n=1 Tax=Streptomyces cavernicola TaxID=3043613 RepID=A0ABT6SCW5_9ACTN|nr:AfsR/SARP family transcriptional regulator [Streptomyces sp. B-S-A6]MDI3405809.1 AfsR/SARP family transcriptional regulator [Streptomyces sp. B-S-A6]